MLTIQCTNIKCQIFHLCLIVPSRFKRKLNNFHLKTIKQSYSPLASDTSSWTDVGNGGRMGVFDFIPLSPLKSGTGVNRVAIIYLNFASVSARDLFNAVAWKLKRVTLNGVIGVITVTPTYYLLAQSQQ